MLLFLLRMFSTKCSGVGPLSDSKETTELPTDPKKEVNLNANSQKVKDPIRVIISK